MKFPRLTQDQRLCTIVAHDAFLTYGAQVFQPKSWWLFSRQKTTSLAPVPEDLDPVQLHNLPVSGLWRREKCLTNVIIGEQK